MDAYTVIAATLPYTANSAEVAGMSLTSPESRNKFPLCRIGICCANRSRCAKPFAAGTSTFKDVLVSNNRTLLFGGGISIRGEAELTNTAIIGNSARDLDGGGVFVFVGNAMLTNVTISGNAARRGGGIHLGCSLNGDCGAASLVNVTLNENSAFDGGGNIYSESDGLVQITNTIVANSLSGGNCGGLEVISRGHNIDTDNTCGFNAIGDVVGTDPQLKVLEKNGGFTPTHAISPNSIAIDAGISEECPSTDQRGTVRPQDGDGDGDIQCDVGAYEFVPSAVINDDLNLDLVDTLYNPDDPRAPAGVFTVTATWMNTSQDSFADVFAEVAVLSGGNVVLNHDLGDGGVGSRISVNLDDDGVLSPGESFTQSFEVGLQDAAPFEFFVNILGSEFAP